MEQLGQFEQTVLTAILALGENAYGVTIHAKVEDLSRPRKIARGAVYATLDRMEDKGLVASWMSAPTPERGGRSRSCRCCCCAKPISPRAAPIPAGRCATRCCYPSAVCC